MRPEQLDAFIEECHERRRAINRRKRHDYATEDDALSNFKAAALICNILEVDGFNAHTPAGVIMVLIATKLVREANLRNSGHPPDNESRQDTGDDIINYHTLYQALEKEARDTEDAEDISALRQTIRASWELYGGLPKSDNQCSST